jgi:hypothetical protein
MNPDPEHPLLYVFISRRSAFTDLKRPWFPNLRLLWPDRMLLLLLLSGMDFALQGGVLRVVFLMACPEKFGQPDRLFLHENGEPPVSQCKGNNKKS